MKPKFRLANRNIFIFIVAIVSMILCGTNLPFVYADHIIYRQNFSDGLPDASEGWTYYSTNSGRIQVADGVLRMDDDTDDTTYSLNEAILELDLTGQTYVELLFTHTSHGDENHPDPPENFPEMFTDHYEGDGVAISDDGTTWYRVAHAGELQAKNTIVLNPIIDHIRSKHDGSFGYNATLKIKFQQYNNFSVFTDGREWDDIVLRGGPFAEAYSGSLTGVYSGSGQWGDFDNDGGLDILLTGDSDSGRVSKIYRNTGSGFNEVYPGSLTGVTESSGQWGDFDNDGYLDILITGDSDSGRVSKIYRNTGSGFNEVYPGSLTGVTESSGQWGDFDNDGDLDILLTGATGLYPNYDSISKIYENTGNGFIEVYHGSLTGVCYGSGQWGDFDNDGDLDILITGNSGISAIVSKVYKNTGNGFTEVYPGSLTGIKYGSSQWGDYDNDGDLDILITGRNLLFPDYESVSRIYKNTGSGFIEVYPGSLTDVEFSSGQWGDYDNDGDLDILITGSLTRKSYEKFSKIYENTGSGFTEAYPGSLEGLGSGSGQWGDFDTDGDLDILITGGNRSYRKVSKIYENTGSGFTEIHSGSLPGVSFGSGQWGDYDNDDDLDILITGQKSGIEYVSGIYENSDSEFIEAYTGSLLGVFHSSGQWGDYDNDGNLDILITGNLGEPNYESVSRIYKNTGSGFIEIYNGSLPGVSSGSGVWGDYDIDGDLDILLTGSSGTAYTPIARIYENLGNGFAEVYPGSLQGVSSGSGQWGDYDNDADLDILITGNSKVYGIISEIYENTYGGFTSAYYGSLTKVSGGSGEWGDFDNDGDLDILITGDGLYEPFSKVYENIGSGFTEIYPSSLTGVYNGSGQWGDYDNDGDLDILITGKAVNDVITKIYENSGSGFVEVYTDFLTGVYRSSGQWGDFDHDGDIDILLTGDSGSGSVSKIYRTNGPCNTKPSVPAMLHSVIFEPSVELFWDNANDIETPSPGLTYNLRVGTSPGGIDILSPMTSHAAQSKVAHPGAQGHNTSWLLKDLKPGTYYWSVQSVDTSFVGSAFAPEQVFTIHPPLVTAIDIAKSDATIGGQADTATFTVTFSTVVSDIDIDDFTLSTTGSASGDIASVSSDSGASVTVTINNLSGYGDLGLNLYDQDDIWDDAGNKLGGDGWGNGDFSGPVYQVDYVSPSVSQISSIAQEKVYTVDAVIPITVTFDEPVIVSTVPGGAPSHLSLETGTSDAVAVYAGGSDPSKTVVFNYEVKADQNSSHLDCSSSAALSLNDGAIFDLNGNSADPGDNGTVSLPAPGTVNSLYGNNWLVIDTIPPAQPEFSLNQTSILTKDTTPTWYWTTGGNGGIGTYRYALRDSEGNLKAEGNVYIPSYTATTPLTPDGDYTLSIQERDEAGNWSSAASRTIKIDTVPPSSVDISGAPKNPVSDTTATLSVSGSNVTDYRYNLNYSVSYSSERSIDDPIDLANLDDGLNTVSVIGRDKAGNWQQENQAKTVSWTVDTTPPTITGLANADTPTKSKTWNWSADETATFRFAIDTDTNGTPSGDFSDIATATQPNGDGAYYLHVQAKDALGNESDVLTVSAILDNTPPVVAIDPPLDDQTAARSKTWTWSATDEDDMILYRYAIDQTETGAPAGGYADVATATKADGTGKYFLHVQARDRAGNESLVVTASAVLDNAPPIVTGLFSDATPVQSKTWNWAAESGDMFRYRIDNSASGTPSGEFSAAASATQPDGDGIFYLHVQARDPLDNVSDVTTVYALLDNTPPTLEGLQNDDATAQGKVWYWNADEPATYRFAIDQNPGGVPDGFYTGVNTATKATGDGKWYIHVQAKDTAGNESGVATVYAALDNTSAAIAGLFDDPVPTQSKTWTWSSDDPDARFRFAIDQNPTGRPTGDYGTAATATQADGTGRYYLHVQARDGLGNESPVKTVYAELDNTPPAPPEVSGASPVNTARPEWRWESGGEGMGLYRYKLDSADLAAGADETQNDGFVPETDLADGEHVLYVQERDQAGNWSDPGEGRVVVDTTLPDPPVRSAGTPAVTRDPKPVWIWTSGGGGVAFRYRLNDSHLDALSTTTTEARFQPESPLADGENILYVQELDEAGNASAAAAFAIRIDTAPPCSRAGAPSAFHDQTLNGAIEIRYTAADRYANETGECGDGTTGAGVDRVELWVKGPGDEAFAPAPGAADEGDALDGVLSLSLDPDIDPQGAYSFYTIAYDKAGNPEPRPDSVDARTVYSADFAGYAVLAVGSVASGEGLEAHTKTAASVYRRLLDRHFLVSDNDNHWTDPLDHVKFFTPYDDEPVPGRDDYTRNPEGGFPIEYRHALEYAVTEWAARRMTEIPGPLYLVLLDHGANDLFFLNGFSQVSAPQLNLWIETLEAALPADFDHPIVIVVGTCYSGSFIDNLSKPGRIVIASTAPDEVSYRGPLTPGQYRDGEFFITALFNGLGRGETLYDSYRQAVELTEMHTDSGRSGIRAPYFDTALQHPYIEADGLPDADGDFGVHDIGYAGDADAAKSVSLGYGAETVPLTVTRTGKERLSLPFDAAENRMWAEVDGDFEDPTDVKVWVEIRRPDQILEGADADRVTSLTVDLVDVELKWDPADARYEAAYDGFWDPGKYTLFFYAMDPEGNISNPARTYVYKASAPPAPGDVNGVDGVTLADVIIALKVAAGVGDDDPVYVEADVNGDGGIGLAEAVFGLREAADGR